MRDDVHYENTVEMIGRLMGSGKLRCARRERGRKAVTVPICSNHMLSPDNLSPDNDCLYYIVESRP